MSSLEVSKLSKSFGRIQALDQVNLSIDDGEFMVLLGPTAAGKTTTLRCVAGLEKLDQGSILMDGEVVNKLSPAERDVAFVFQSYALYPRKTAFENMAFPLQASKMPAELIKTRIHEVAEKLHIKELLNRRPAEMSGGQQQRVALGRAMVREPRMFLMDEPLTNLDFKLRVEMRAELKYLQRQLATTFFYVTNDQVEAMSVADRIAVLNKGVLQQVATPEEIYDHPVNLFVAQFVGSPRMNTLACKFDLESRALVGNGWQMPLADHQIEKLKTAADPNNLIFGIRCEDLQLYSQAQTNSFPGEIYILEPLGDRTYVDIQMAHSTIKARAAAEFDSPEGASIWVQFHPDRFHVFEQKSQKTIF